METTNVMEKHWEEYLLACRAEKLKPSFRDFLIWYQENYET